MDRIERGAAVKVRTFGGEWLVRRALTGAVMGHDFSVVWVCREEEWRSAEDEGRDPEGIPWPAEDVQPAQSVGA